MSTQPSLPSCLRAPLQLLLSSRRFSTDELLIAADYLEEYAAELEIEGLPGAAGEAREFVERLREEAPRRASYHASVLDPAGWLPEIQCDAATGRS